MKKLIHVAVGIIINSDNEILIAKRPETSHQGGLWEFPGGKVEKNETVFDALAREFKEEVNIDIQQAEPFMEVQHVYNDEKGDKCVLLDVWLCKHFTGDAIGVERQQVQWVTLNSIDEFQFPEANKTIIKRLISEL